MNTVREVDEDTAVKREHPEPPPWRRALGTVAAADRRAQDAFATGVDVTCRTLWAWECRGQMRVENACGRFLVNVLRPALVVPIQATTWCVRWRALTDALTDWLVQAAAAALLAFLGWLGYLGVWWPLLAVCAVPALVVAAFGVGRLTYRHTTRGAVRGLFRPDGWANYLELHAGMSAHAVREVALYTRPSVKARVTRPGAERHSDVLLSRVPVSECGTWVGRTAIGPPFPVNCYSSHETGKLILAAPRKLKTSAMTRMVKKAPGCAISTQTKPGTYHDTWVIRQEHSLSGYGVHLLDPEHTTGHKSTFWWAPERGCRDESVARQRASALIIAATKMGEDGPMLQQQASIVLRALLCLADLIPDRDMRDVFKWASNHDELKKAVDLMGRWREQMPHGWPAAAAGVVHNTAVRTVGVILIALGDAVGFMADSNVTSLCVAPPDAGPEDYGFDVAEFVADRGTLYLIATDRETDKVGPLLAALTDHIVMEAKRIANGQPGHRLDPPMHLSLDEAANTIAMPLPKWLSDTGGRGLEPVASLQSRSQAVERWGAAGAETLWNAATVKLIGGGFQSKEDLEAIAAVLDTRTVVENGQQRQVPVLQPHELRRVPRAHAVLLHDADPTTIVRVPGPWTDPDIIRARMRARMMGEPASPPRALEAPASRRELAP